MWFRKSNENNTVARGAAMFRLPVFAFILSVLIGTCVQAQTPAELVAHADQLAERSDWHDAGPLYEKAEVAYRKTGDTKNELYAKFGRLHRDLADGSYRAVRAETVKTLANPAVQSDPQLQIRGLALLGNIDLNSDTAAALQDWTEVRSIASKIGDEKWQNRAQGELGLVAGVNGDIGSAGLALYSAIAKADQIGDVAAHVNFATWLANGMAVQGMADRALGVLDQAADFAKNHGYPEPPLQLSIARVRALGNLPESQTDRGGDIAKLITATLAQAEREHVSGAQTDLLNESGQLYAKHGDIANAETAFRQAVERSQAAGLPRQEAEAYLHLSQLYRASNQLPKASTAVDHGIQALQRVEEGYDLPLFLAEKAEVQSSLGQVQAADASFQRATDLAAGLLVNAPTSQVKSGMIDALSQIYLGHFRLAWTQMHNAPYAFSIIENARGRALLDSIRYARQTRTSSVAETPAEVQITRLQRSLLHDQMTNVQTRRVLGELDQAYTRLNPVEYQRQRSEMGLVRKKPISATLLQTQLTTTESLVEYVLDQRGSYAICVSRSGVKVVSLPPRAEISRLARAFVTAIRTNSESRSSGQSLYKAVIEPVVIPGTTSLIVIPDGPLHLVPFAALVNPQGAYLTTQLTLSAAPSASVYYTLNRAPRTTLATKPFLGVAFSPSAQSNVTSASTVRGVSELRAGSLKPLRFAREEVTQAAAVFGTGSVMLEGTQASETELKAEPLADFKIIHLAAHGVSDATEPDRAALVLSPGSQAEDGLWQAREIQRTRLNADAVILSACETGSGRLQGQEGVMNLARAFLIAGARSVVASLWDVEDRSTATLMESFYAHLKEGKTVNEALRQAQLDFIKDYKDKAAPNLWAGFEVIGDGTKRFTFEKSDLRGTR